MKPTLEVVADGVVAALFALHRRVLVPVPVAPVAVVAPLLETLHRRSPAGAIQVDEQAAALFKEPLPYRPQ